MEGQDVQHLDLSQSFSEPYTADEFITLADIPGIWHPDSQLPNLSSCTYSHPLCDQAAHYCVLLHPNGGPWYWLIATRSTVLLPGQIPEAGVQMTCAPDMSDGNSGDEFGAFSDDQIWEYGARPGRRITDPEDSLQGINSPFDQGNGVDVQLRNPGLFCTGSHGQPVHLSPQQLKYTPDAHLESPFEHHPGQRVEAPRFGTFQRIPEIEIAQGSKNRAMGPKKWSCHYDGCDKSYKRPQDVRRHIRDNHKIPPTCPICGIKWTRPEKIRKHLVSRHENHFTEEECQDIGLLEGLNNTIDFLKKWETTRL